MKLIIFVALCVALGVNAEEEFSPYIINGVRGQHAPYYAYIEYFNAAGLGFFGGGALVSDRHIVTAATNVAGYARIEVRMGSATRGSMRLLQLATTNPITQHPSYNAQTRAADIAIIRLQNPILPSAEIAPIALPPIITGGLVLPYENEEGFFTGFGVQIQGGQPANFIQRGYQRAIGNTRCTTFFNLNTLSAFCAEDEAERSNACDGDVGNPFVLNYRRQEILAGLVTMHPRCGQMSPTAYTRITYYRSWIQTQLQS